MRPYEIKIARGRNNAGGDTMRQLIDSHLELATLRADESFIDENDYRHILTICSKANDGIRQHE
jgi:hypothetical protein